MSTLLASNIEIPQVRILSVYIFLETNAEIITKKRIVSNRNTLFHFTIVPSKIYVALVKEIEANVKH